MRFPEDRIKEAILHPDLDVRQMAVRYFAAAHSPDDSVMPLVIQAVEHFGKQDAFSLIGLSSRIAQTAETIDWIIGELNQNDSNYYDNYIYNLSMVLLNSDPRLLLPRESDILEARYFFHQLHHPFCERLQMLGWDEDICWQKLESFCNEAKDIDDVTKVDLSYGKRIVESLARYGTSCEQKVEALLRQDIVDYSRHPMKWMEPLLVELAGEAQLESLISLILSKLDEDCGDFVNQACAEALTQIGTPAVLEAVSQIYSNAPSHFWIYASDPLENIHSDLAVEKCLHLLRQAKDRDVQIILATALLSQFASEGIEESRKLLVGHKLNFESRGLRNQLLKTCVIMEERFPEYDEWVSEMTVEREEHQERVRNLGDDPTALMQFALENLTERSNTTDIEPDAPILPDAPSKIEGKHKVGRNDLCPCGSGKKYKKCCLNKRGIDPLRN